jgi:2',3'-cyclic-nucleotide 2'-phosphodiesterase (5'-nucleotidase family)
MRKPSIKKFLCIAAILALAATFFTGCVLKPEPGPTAEIILLHTNDTHGRVAGNDTDVIGIDRIAAIHAGLPNSILLDAGDATHGLPIATLLRGADIIALMGEAGYAAMAVGNHEFNYGWERLRELRDMAGFPFLASNMKKDGALALDDTVLIEADGVMVGVFGLITEDAAHLVMPAYIDGMAFEDTVAEAKAKVDALRGQGAHVVVALCHMGYVPTEGGTLTPELARAVPGIDVIIDGHSHTVLEQGVTENGVLIAQAGDNGKYLGKVTIALEDGKITSKTASLIDYDEAQKTAPDEAVAARLAAILAEQEVILREPVGEAAAAMSAARAPGVRTQEMPFGIFLADAYREAAGTHIAVANGGDIRADLKAGKVTKGDIVSVLPFGNTLMVKTVTPAQLRAALENGVSGIVLGADGKIDHEQSAQGRFLHPSGFRFTYDPAAPVGQRIVSITLDDGLELPLDDTATPLRLAGTNYVMTGGDAYTMLGEIPVDQELCAADEALAAYVGAHSPAVAPEAGRITVL